MFGAEAGLLREDGPLLPSLRRAMFLARMAARAVPFRARILATRKAGPAPLALAVYGGLSLLTLAIAMVREQTPIETEPYLDLPGPVRHVGSVALGIALAVLTIRATRLFVARWGWAKTLHTDLRPAVRDAADGAVLVLGIASGVAEELFFRGLLAPLLGLILSSLAFGALHQLRGRAGWTWSLWATVMGLLFGGLFLVTGSLLGPIVAHAAINVFNLRFLRDTDVEPAPHRNLGGLLR